MIVPCKFRRSSLAPGHVSCACPSLIHGGCFPIEICHSCPLSTTESNSVLTFEEQTNNLLRHLQHSGDYVADQRPCGGCTDKTEGRTLQFVWPYWHKGAAGDEIRFSVRSVEKFFQGEVKITILGDKPPWYTGHFIHQSRVKRGGRYRDMLSKIWTMATHPEVDEEFVWMMADDYFIKPFSVEDIKVPRAERYGRGQANGWQILKSDSMRELELRGMTNHDYATHLPHHADKKKLLEMYDAFDMKNKTLLWEVIYGNAYRSSPHRSRPFLARIKTAETADHIRHYTQNATVLNHTHSGWSAGMREFLSDLLPDPSIVEDVNVVAMNPGPKRVVKRRHPSTHRANKQTPQS